MLNNKENNDVTDILIAYYTHSGNTQNIANKIKEITDGDLFQIEPVKKYPRNYQEVLKVSKKEIEDNYKPALVSKIKNFNKYKIIFVGSPNWYGTIAPPVATFLNEHDFLGKTIMPFISHGGGGKANCFTDILKIIPKAIIKEGLAIYYSGGGETIKQTIQSWIEQNK